MLLAVLGSGITIVTTGADLQGRGGVINHYEVHNAKVSSICKQLSDYSGVDIIVSDKISSSVSLSVSNKTWKEILEIVCKIHNLAVSNEGSYLYILSHEEQSKRIVESATNFQATQELSPLRREIIQIKHTAAGDIEKSIQTLLSTRGKLTVIQHTNALVVYDTKENIDQIRQMIIQLDVETAQISISCKIIEKIIHDGALF